MTTLPPYTIRESRVINGEECLRCSKCKEWLELDKFGTNKFTRSGHQSHCKECQKDGRAKSREKQRAKHAAKCAEMAVRKAFSRKQPIVRKPSKTPQKSPPRKRKAIPAMSTDKIAWNQLYKSKHEADPEVVQGYSIRWEGGSVPVITRIHGPKGCFERHHVGRRWRWLLLWYRYVTPALHKWIEDNSQKARELGLLFDVVRGEMRNPSRYDPLESLGEFEQLKAAYS